MLSERFSDSQHAVVDTSLSLGVTKEVCWHIGCPRVVVAFLKIFIMMFEIKVKLFAVHIHYKGTIIDKCDLKLLVLCYVRLGLEIKKRYKVSRI